MDISAYTLTTLKDAARIPYLAEAAALALEIRNINSVQSAKLKGGHFKRLAHYACALVCTVYRRQENNRELSPPVDMYIKELESTLKEIFDFSRKQTSRIWFMRVILSKSDVTQVQKYRKELELISDKFRVQSTFETNKAVRRIDMGQKAMLEELQQKPEARTQAEGVHTGGLLLTPSAISCSESYNGTFTSVEGNQSQLTVASSNTHTNSGNVLTITTTGSNNHSSDGGRRRKR